jgi:hypothetical protein
MYLAEDRVRGKCDVNVIWTFVSHTVSSLILCWELVSKRGASWVLHVKSAYAITDTPDQMRVELSWSSLSI